MDQRRNIDEQSLGMLRQSYLHSPTQLGLLGLKGKPVPCVKLCQPLLHESTNPYPLARNDNITGKDRKCALSSPLTVWSIDVYCAGGYNSDFQLCRTEFCLDVVHMMKWAHHLYTHGTHARPATRNRLLSSAE